MPCAQTALRVRLLAACTLLRYQDDTLHYLSHPYRNIRRARVTPCASSMVVGHAGAWFVRVVGTAFGHSHPSSTSSHAPSQPQCKLRLECGASMTSRSTALSTPEMLLDRHRWAGMRAARANGGADGCLPERVPVRPLLSVVGVRAVLDLTVAVGSVVNVRVTPREASDVPG